MPGTGRVYTYTWTDRPVTPQLAHLGVYNITVVELDGTHGEPVRVLSRVEGVAREALQVGSRWWWGRRWTTASRRCRSSARRPGERL